MDIFEHARTHHRRAVQLVGQVKAAESEQQRKTACDELRKELREHEVIEAGLLYPALEETGVMQTQLGSLLGEHAHLKALGARVLTADPRGPEWQQALDELAASLTRHVNAEESQVFPRARNTLDVREIERLSRQADDPEASLAAPGGEGRSAASEGEEIARKASGRARDAGERAGEEAGEWAGEAGRRVRSAVREQGEAVAGRGHTLADALRETGESLERKGEEGLAHYVSGAAEGIDRWMRRLEGGDIDRITGEIDSAARRHPTMFFAAAVGVGFIAARFLKGSRTGNGRSPGHPREGAGPGGKASPGL